MSAMVLTLTHSSWRCVVGLFFRKPLGKKIILVVMPHERKVSVGGADYPDEVKADPPLSIEGAVNAHRVVSEGWLKEVGPSVKRIYCPPFSRILSTASALALKYGVPIETMEGLGQAFNTEDGRPRMFYPGFPREKSGMVHWQADATASLHEIWSRHDDGDIIVVYGQKPVIATVVGLSWGVVDEPRLRSIAKNRDLSSKLGFLVFTLVVGGGQVKLTPDPHVGGQVKLTPPPDPQ